MSVKIELVYAEPTPPSIKEVVLTLDIKDAIRLAAILGSFGGETGTGHIYRVLVDTLNLSTSMMAEWRANPLNELYRVDSEMAKDAIVFRGNHIERGRPNHPRPEKTR